MTSRLMVAAVGLGTVLSTVVLGLMLAGPFLPPSPSPIAGEPSATPSASSTPGPRLPPIGLYLSRGPFSFGLCLGIELEARSYPVGADSGPGQATVLWWERGVADAGNPDACATRSSDLNHVPATVRAEFSADAPTDDPIAYVVAFGIESARDVPSARFEITVLARQSTDMVLQATAEGGEGLVFDRVEEIDPPFNPLPTPEAAFEPQGVFLLAGPVAPDGPCLVVELDSRSYPAQFGASGTARIRWWERVGAQPGNAEDCLGRTGEVSEAETSVNAPGPEGAPDGYFIGLPADVLEALGTGTLFIQVGGSTADVLIGVVGTASGEVRVVLNRVDSIDPPLVPPASSSP